MLSQIIYHFPFDVLYNTFSAKSYSRMSPRKNRNITFPHVKYKAKIGTGVNQNEIVWEKHKAFSCWSLLRPNILLWLHHLT